MHDLIILTTVAASITIHVYEFALWSASDHRKGWAYRCREFWHYIPLMGFYAAFRDHLDRAKK